VHAGVAHRLLADNLTLGGDVTLGRTGPGTAALSGSLTTRGTLATESGSLVIGGATLTADSATGTLHVDASLDLHVRSLPHGPAITTT